MKKLLFVFSMVIVTMFSLSSCFKTSELNNAYFACYGTIYGNYTSGYQVLSDDGVIFIPTKESILNAIPALAKDNNIRRVFFTFNVVGDEQPSQFIPGAEYDINIVNTGINYGAEASNLIDTYNNPEAADTLMAHPLPIISVNQSKSWVANGYVNLYTYFTYNLSYPFTIDLAYNSSCDVDANNNEVTLTLCLNSLATTTNQPISTYLHFRLPDDLQAKMKVDEKVTINVKGMADVNSTVITFSTLSCSYDEIKESTLFRN